MDRITELELALAAALERIEVLERAAQDQAPQASTAPPPAPPAAATSNETGRAARLDRRRLLTRGGTAAVGAVLGGAAATIATASPAAAATGTFDSTDGTTALTATNTGTGHALEVTANGPAPAAQFTSSSEFVGVGVAAEDASIGLFAVGKDHGIFGRATRGLAAHGVAGEGTGFASAGVAGQGTDGAYGTIAYSPDSTGAYAWGKNSSLQLGPRPLEVTETTPAPRGTDIEHWAGALAFDAGSDLWLCVADGTPGTWVRVSGAGSAGPLQMLASPVRVYDSRAGYPPTGGTKTPLDPGVDRVIDCTNNTSGIPTDATAAIVTITIADPTGPGWLAVRANGAPYTGTSTLNWTEPGTVIATTTTTALGPDATIAIRTLTTTDAIVDLIGYHR